MIKRTVFASMVFSLLIAGDLFSAAATNTPSLTPTNTRTPRTTPVATPTLGYGYQYVSTPGRLPRTKYPVPGADVSDPLYADVIMNKTGSITIIYNQNNNTFYIYSPDNASYLAMSNGNVVLSEAGINVIQLCDSAVGMELSSTKYCWIDADYGTTHEVYYSNAKTHGLIAERVIVTGLGANPTQIVEQCQAYPTAAPNDYRGREWFNTSSTPTIRINADTGSIECYSLGTVHGISTPQTPTDAANKDYVDFLRSQWAAVSLTSPVTSTSTTWVDAVTTLYTPDAYTSAIEVMGNIDYGDNGIGPWYRSQLIMGPVGGTPVTQGPRTITNVVGTLTGSMGYVAAIVVTPSAAVSIKIQLSCNGADGQTTTAYYSNLLIHSLK